jgi:Zn-dependent metalloprotease
MNTRFVRLVPATLALTLLCAPLTAMAENTDQMKPNEHRELQRITEINGGTIQITWDEQRGTPRQIAGKLSQPLKGDAKQMAFDFLTTIKDLYHVDNVKKSFRLKRIDHNQLGMKHVRLTHVANSVPVWGDEIIVHIDKSGVVRSVNGQFTPKIEAHSERIKKPQIDAQTAIKNAMQDVKTEKPDRPPTAELHYFPYPTPESVTLTYIVTVLDQSQPAEWKVFVDAITGDIVHKYNNLKTGGKGVAPNPASKKAKP